ncbi:MAG TPA: head-tail connector protein [Devosia sp.]|jgi:uncharacterized phiE125 gp8 family phage protein|nr:head-tail connector protein [Devosia sp.]
MARTALTRIAAPAKLPITLEAAKGWMRVDYNDEDALITSLIEAAVDRLDGPTGLLNRALIEQEWVAHFDRFPTSLKIPLPRCREIVEVAYVAPDGVAAVLDVADYQVVGLHTDMSRIQSIPTQTWPGVARGWPDAVSIRFKAGFGPEPEDVPASIRHALLEMVATGFENREGIAVGERVSMQVLPLTARSVVSDWKVWFDHDE